MKNRNVVIALICIPILVAGALVAWREKDALSHTLVAVGIKESRPEIADAKPYMEKLRGEIPVFKVLPKRKKDGREIWKVGRGISLPNYLLRAQRHLNKSGGEVLYMEESLDKNGNPVANFDFAVPFGDTFRVELQIADSFNDNTSRLAVGFYASEKLSKYIDNLNRLAFPYSLLITPAEKASYDDALGKLQNFAPVIWLPMEDKKLQSRSLSKSTVRIHLSDAEIREIVSDAIRQMPDARGVATRQGSRAVEQKALLRAVLGPLKEQGLWFMDLTANRYSKSMEACESMNVKCRTVYPLDLSRMTHAIYVSKILKAAQRSGKAILLLPLSGNSFEAIEDLKDEALAQGTEIVDLSHLFQNE